MNDIGSFTITGIILIAITLLVIGIDLYLVITKKPTFSVVIYKVSWVSPAVVFAAGFIAGHWFW